MSVDPIQTFLDDQALPASYRELMENRFAPLAETIARHQEKSQGSLLVGINGCQGSGKSTLADALVLLLRERHQKTAVSLSIDDFYLTRAEREQLARDVHPLLQTRGVPGTHDINLAMQTLDDLISEDSVAHIPRFDKATDDRIAPEKWQPVATPVDVIILEGWCVGATPQTPAELLEPVNSLERDEDPDSRWRRYVNESLENDYQTLFNRLTVSVMLKAPSFATVLKWRTEQEERLRTRKLAIGEDVSELMTEQQIERFIQHYQRITEHSLRYMPQRVNFLFNLDEQRQIVSAATPRQLSTD